MRVKVGNHWFEASPGRPIQVELTEADRANIANMHPDATKYAVFDDGDATTSEEKLAWMRSGQCPDVFALVCEPHSTPMPCGSDQPHL